MGEKAISYIPINGFFVVRNISAITYREFEKVLFAFIHSHKQLDIFNRFNKNRMKNGPVLLKYFLIKK